MARGPPSLISNQEQHNRLYWRTGVLIPISVVGAWRTSCWLESSVPGAEPRSPSCPLNELFAALAGGSTKIPSSLIGWGKMGALSGQTLRLLRPADSAGFLELGALLPANFGRLVGCLPTERDSEARHHAVAGEVHLGMVLIAGMVIVVGDEVLHLLHAPLSVVPLEQDASPD